MTLEVRTQQWPDRGGVPVHVVELVIGGIIFRTEAASAAHAMELAVRVARVLGMDLARDLIEAG